MGARGHYQDVILRVFIILLLSLTLKAAEPARSDGQIEGQLKTRLAKSVIGRDGFKFRVKDGVVYWSGSTAIPQHKGGATRMAKSAGARRVVNEIRVAGAKNPVRAAETSGAEKAGSDPTKPPLAAKSPAIIAPSPVANVPTAASPKRATVHWVPTR